MSKFLNDLTYLYEAVVNFTAATNAHSVNDDMSGTFEKKEGSDLPCLNVVPKYLPKEITALMASRRWSELLSCIALHPNELLSLRDENSQTALHYACLYYAPPHVVEILVRQCPGLASMTNRDGELALHWAVRLGAPNEILELLLAANPDSGIVAKDTKGTTPLTILWDRHKKSFMQHWRCGRETLLEFHAWNRFLILLKFYESSRTKHDATLRPLHVASGCPCPPGLFGLLTEVYRDDVRVKNCEGNLPLFIACSDVEANRSIDVGSRIQALTSAYPDGVLETDSFGRSPLCIACGSGVSWEEGISTLIAAAPRSISTPDPVSGLYPFMLAASCAGRTMCSTVSSCDTEELASLSTIYQTVLADPCLVTKVLSTS